MGALYTDPVDDGRQGGTTNKSREKRNPILGDARGGELLRVGIYMYPNLISNKQAPYQGECIGGDQVWSWFWTPVEGWKVPLSKPVQGPSAGAFENKKDKVIGG